MKHTTLITAFLLFIIVNLGCNKTDSPGSRNEYQPEFVTATISGQITDDAGMPVNGALVKVGLASANTDINGSFTINNVSVDKKAAFVKAEKDGFFLGTKTVVAVANKNNQVAIRLIRKALAGTITGSGGGTVTVPSNGGSIAFESNGVVNPTNNTAYTGTVSVHAFFINPEASDFKEIMPGTLRGITTNNQETGLQSFGMMAVELTGSGGEKLQLAAGKKATLHFPIPASLQGEAPATIPLWSLDETTGLWKEEGSATRNGSEYIGMVSHFSFWNCDAPFPVIDFTGIIKNQLGNSIEGAEVVIAVPAGESTAGSITGNGFTNAEGVFSGKLPANKSLQLKVYNKCRTLLLTKNIGPFSSTTDLGVITVNSTASEVTFSGTVKNCLNEPVANGFVTINLEDIYYNVPVTNGSFTTIISRCSNGAVTATITTFDVAKQEAGNEVSVPVSGNTVNAGNLFACGATADTYIRYTLDGVSYQLLPPTDTVRYYDNSANSSITYIEGKRSGKQWEDIVVMFHGPKTTGSHKVIIADVFHGGENVLYFRNTNFDINITEFGNAGEYVSGNFSATLRDSLNSKIVPINYSFRVKRE